MPEKVLAFAKQAASSWPAEQAVGATDGLPFITESLSKAGPDLADDQGPDQEQQENAFMGNIAKNEGSVEAHARFLTYNELLAMIMGSDTSVVVDGVDSPNAYDHTMALKFGADLLGLWGSLVLDENTAGHDINVWPGAKPRGFTFDHDSAAATPLKLTIDWITSHLLSAGQSTTNQAAQIAAVTYRSKKLPIMPWMGVFRIKKVTGAEAALGSGDIVKVGKATIGLKRSYVPQFASDDEGAATEPQATYEPEQQAYDELVLSLTFNKQDAVTKAFLLELTRTQDDDPTQYKCDIVYTSPEIANPGDTTEVPFRITFEFPNLVPMPDIAAAIADPHLNEVVVPFKVLAAASAPAGMTVTDYLRIIARDNVSAAYV